MRFMFEGSENLDRSRRDGVVVEISQLVGSDGGRTSVSFYKQVWIVAFSGCPKPGSSLSVNPSNFLSRSLNL